MYIVTEIKNNTCVIVVHVKLSMWMLLGQRGVSDDMEVLISSTQKINSQSHVTTSHSALSAGSPVALLGQSISDE